VMGRGGRQEWRTEVMATKWYRMSG
jgi:hypothetical protein